MNIEKYLTAYESYRDTVLGMKKAVRRMNMGKYAAALPVGEMIDFVDYEELEREYEKKRRILTQATRRLQRAISAISDPRLSNYLECRYLYRMTNEKYAESFNYCERQVYRIGKAAKAELYRHLVVEMPRAKRWKTEKKFSFSPRRAKKSFRKFGPRARRRG